MELEKRDGKRWNVIERAVNGYTAKDLLRLIQMDNIPDCTQACVMIGTNDCKIARSDYKNFGEYVHRIDTALRTKGVFPMFAEIPPIYLRGGDFPYTKTSPKRRMILNSQLKTVLGRLVEMPLDKDCYEDAVHFNDKGNRTVAKLFAEAICSV